ncbi:glyoxalase/bleomycin resistance/extradiol dioxygenase family protein [Tumidithrix elongata RA019]|uniref:Glyoxalase/bleomycin resistance/extradiol dioxygenase family protein n=1 Tax=Tumidithrix elongata BACA0141 TaxID=2716417 RepID=A0AAW9PQ64_9CYAN|nr:glyoxalase/bleomycin resistance/extradiol dioxygenase family protein [Tumidithrix elongata RA019]
MQLNPYLFFNGNCQEAFEFYEQCLGGKIAMKFLNENAPPEGQMTEMPGEKIMHIRLEVGDWVLMGGDCPPQMFEESKGFRVNLAIDDPAESERIFHLLAENGTVQMPIQQTFWAFRFGMVTDRFGTPWMVNCEKES